MNALSENMLIAALTGLISAGTAFLALPPTAMLDTRTILGCLVGGIVGFAGAALNGLRQKAKEPDAK